LYVGAEEKKGAGGLRILIVVENAQDIQRAGEVLFKRLWLAGYGRIEISKSGALLVRSLIDDSVWQPERFDFEAGAACVPPVVQRRPPAMILNPDTVPLATRQALPYLTQAEENEYKRLVEEAKAAMREQATQITFAWVEEHVAAEIEAKKVPPEDVEQQTKKLREKYSQAVNGGLLLGDFELISEDGERVTVGKILDNPAKWHNTRFHDPLEPDYRNDRRIAWANLRCAGRPYVYSHAHGGRRFVLCRARRQIEWIRGERVQQVRQIMELARIDGTLFSQGGNIVKVDEEGKIITLLEDGVRYYLDGVAKWEKFDRRTETLIPIDAPKELANGMANETEVKLPKLTAVATAPILDVIHDRMIETDGYDQKTGLLLVLKDNEWSGIPARPTLEEARRAMTIFWKPFERFPFDGPQSRGAWVSCVLTASIRQSLPTAPGTLIVSPCAGSGKTLLGLCAAGIAGLRVALMAPSGSSWRDADDEIRKRLTAFSLEGSGTLILDNLVGVFESSALCAWLTAGEYYTDRILGVSKTTPEASVSTRANLIITGNNVTLQGDLCRRIMTCRIDPKAEKPWKRLFDLEPRSYCKEHRYELLAAAFTLIRYALQNYEAPKDRAGSFEVWSDIIRRTIIMIGNEKLLDVSDPTDTIDEAYALDPDTQKLAAFLDAVYRVKQSHKWLVADLIKLSCDGTAIEQEILEGPLYEIAGDVRAKGLNPKILGWWIAKHAGRVFDDKKIERGPLLHKVQTWSIDEVK
jgi:hypothetical protein